MKRAGGCDGRKMSFHTGSRCRRWNNSLAAPLIVLLALILTGCDKPSSHIIVGTIAAPPQGPATKSPSSLQVSPVFADHFANPSSEFWASRDGEEWTQKKEHAVAVSAQNWREKYNSYGRALVARAAERHLDSASLSNVLKWILADGERHKMAYLPFAAYYTEINGEPVWVVDLTWEYEGFGHFGHIRMYAISARNLRQVGFTTCT